MSMEINGKYGQYATDYTKRLEEEREKVKEAEKEQNGEKISDKLSDLHDEYISSEKSGVKPSGLYRLGQDEDGRKKVFYDDPKKADKADEDGNPKVNNPEKSAKECTTNTDKVDREIEKLKEKQQQLKQQIKSASGDETKVKELEKKLAQVESKLSQKDNDTYRRQNASVSETVSSFV